MPRSVASGKRAGFRLMDLLVAVLLVNLLGGVVLASVARVRAAALRAQSSNNLKQIVLATISCADSHDGKLPPGRGNFYPTTMLAAQTGYGPCLFHILPYIEQDNLYKASFVTQGPIAFYASWQGAGNPLKVYIGPGDPTTGPPSDRTSYLANGLALPRFGARYPASFADGTSNTIVYAEAYSRTIGSQSETVHSVTIRDKDERHSVRSQPETVERRWWDDPTWTPTLTGVTFQLAPAAEAVSARLPQSFNPNGLQVAMGDGGIHTVTPGCSSQTFFHACTPSGGEILGSDW